MAESKIKNDAVEPAPVEKKPVCDNHPDREGKVFTGNGAFHITLCEECTPPWFKDE